MNFVNKNSQINKMYLCKHLKKKHSPKQFEFRWQKEKQNKTTTISINRLIANSLEKLTVISIVNHYSVCYLFVCSLVFWELFVLQFSQGMYMALCPNRQILSNYSSISNTGGNWQLELPANRSGTMSQIHSLENGLIQF